MKRFIFQSLILICVLAQANTARTATGGAVVAWGEISYSQTNIPGGLSGVAGITDGEFHTVILKNDGTVVAWGNNFYGQSTVPSGLTGVLAIAAGDTHTVALKNDGMVVAWGGNYSGETNVPSGLTGVVAISAQGYYTMALKNDGTVSSWGANTYGQTNVPSGLSGVVAIAAGYSHSVALKSDGTVVAWGGNSYGQTTGPSGLSGVLAIAAGRFHTVALKNDGTVAVWGQNSYGQTKVPEDLTGVIKIASGDDHVMALRNDGTVVAWGDDRYGQIHVPTGLCGVNAILAAGRSSLALGPLLLTGPVDVLAQPHGNGSFQIAPFGTAPFTFQWRFDGFPIPGATNSTLTRTNVAADKNWVGNYSVVVSDGINTVISSGAKLALNASQDAFANPQIIAGGGGRLLTSNIGASLEAGEPYHVGNIGGHSLWYSWTAPSSSAVVVDTIGSNFDTLLAVYTGTVVSNLTLIAANDDGAGINNNSRLSFNTVAGVTYRIVVDGYNGATGGVVLIVTPGLTLTGQARIAPGAFGFQTSGPGTSNVVIQSSIDLRDWAPLSTNTVPDAGTFQFTDPQAADVLRRFYRAVLK